MLLFFLISTITSITAPTIKMIVVWGTPVTYSNPVQYEGNSLGDCIEKCLTEDCWMASDYETGCYIFPSDSVSSVKMLDKSSGRRVAFKRTIDSDKCLIDNDPPFFGAVMIQDPLYNLSKTYSADGSLTSQFNMKCASDSFLVTRDNYSVCLSPRAFPSPYCNGRNRALALCQEDNGIGLSAQYSVPELVIIQGHWRQVYTAANVGLPASTSSKIAQFWSDGSCSNNATKCTYSDPTLQKFGTFPGNNKRYNPNDFLFLEPNATGVYAIPCTMTAASVGGCLRGALCRTSPVS